MRTLTQRECIILAVQSVGNTDDLFKIKRVYNELFNTRVGVKDIRGIIGTWISLDGLDVSSVVIYPYNDDDSMDTYGVQW